MMKTIMALATASTLALIATPALAADETALETVRYSDLNLNDRSDAMRMLRRLRQASRDICDDRSGRMSLSERVFRTKCVRETTGESVAQLGNDNVRDLYEVRGR
jgi:UrcA family protein